MVQAIPWYVAVLITIPQTYLIIAIGFNLFNFKVATKSNLAISILFAFICYFLRKLPIVFEVDTTILFLMLTIISYFTFGIKLRYCLVSVLLGVLISAVFESVSLPLFLKLSGMNLKYVLANPWLNILAFLPNFLALSFILFMINYKAITIYDFGSRGETTA